MLAPVPRAERALLSPLFNSFPGLHGVIDSVLEGVLGDAWADDLARPRVARLELDFQLIAGDPTAPAAAETIRAIPGGEHLAVPESWEELLVGVRDTVQAYDRFAFEQPERWDRARLKDLSRSLPEGFLLERVTKDNVAAFEALADSLVYNFESRPDFLARGVGFGVRHEGAFVAGCSSFAISSRSLEFEVQTRPEYERRGFALAASARMLEHCLDHGLTPCWDAAHEGSARLAERLGFGQRRPYTAYRLG